MRNCILALLAIVFLNLTAGAAFAVNPDEVLSDPVLEERARKLSVEIRCLVCQNQSIDDSDAQLARDLRALVREKLVEGLSDEDILDYLVKRYGEFVLLRPRFGPRTLMLWVFPIGVLLIGGFIALRMFRKGSSGPGTEMALSDEEKRQLDAITDRD